MEYVELHCHSSFSLLDGTATPTDLVARAADVGMTALALTDHNAVYGAVPFITAAKARGIQPILGAELTLEDGHHLTLLVADAQGWRNLCQLISRAQANAPKGQAALPLDALDEQTDGLICLSGCRQGPIAATLRRWDRSHAYKAARWLRERFGDERTYIELQHHFEPDDDALLRGLVDLARTTGLRTVATNNVHYVRRDDHRLADVLTAIRHRTTLDAAGTKLRGNSEYYVKSFERMLPLFRDMSAALATTLHIAEQCQFDLSYGLQDLPLFPTPPGLDAPTYLACE